MSEKIEKQAESLIEILTEQCADLESLLSLAREESDAAKQGNFAKIIDIYDERAELGSRLETFQQQINELRETLGHAIPAQISDRISSVVTRTLAYDKETTKLLSAANGETQGELAKLARTRHNTKLYSTKKPRGVAVQLKA